jgi:hypothetical protein
MVKPPMRSMIVGENICEKTNLQHITQLFISLVDRNTYEVASFVFSRLSLSTKTRKSTSNNGTNIEVTKRGIG